MEPVELRDERLLLRAPRLSDAAAIHEACQDPETQRWTTIPVPYRESDAVAFIRDHAGAGWRDGSMAVFVITDVRTGCYQGTLDLRLDGVGGAEIGFAVAPWARRKGIATNAVRLVCEWGFRSLALQRIEWQAAVGNWGSRRVAERTGFTVEGTCRQRLVHRGVRCDGWIGGLLPGELR